jgi:NADP-reducing hydrogenase subunit HndB
MDIEEQGTMPKLNSPEELERFREEVQGELQTRLESGATITVGVATCGIAAGAQGTRRAILEELDKREIDAHVALVGCIGMCAKEPLVDVRLPGQRGASCCSTVA